MTNGKTFFWVITVTVWRENLIIYIRKKLQILKCIDIMATGLHDNLSCLLKEGILIFLQT